MQSTCEVEKPQTLISLSEDNLRLARELGDSLDKFLGKCKPEGGGGEKTPDTPPPLEIVEGNLHSINAELKQIKNSISNIINKIK